MKLWMGDNMSEKLSPTYSLSSIQSTFCNAKKLSVTGTALDDAATLGFDPVEMVKTIQTIRSTHFYKSMTTYANHKLWQDVYHVPSRAGILYVKFQADLITQFRLMSFKEK